MAPRYPSAHEVAPKVHQHFARYLDLAVTPVGPGTDAPTARDVEELVDAAFWASLRREEGYLPRISLALVPPDHAIHPLFFDRPLSLGPVVLVRVAPAVERPGIHLGVWRDADGDLKVWGTTRMVPSHCMVLEVAGPGLLVIKHHRGDGGKFVNVAVIEGEQIKMIDDNAKTLPDCPPLVTSLIGFDAPGRWSADLNVLVELAVSMRAHGRGGMILVVPSTSATWRESIVEPIPYGISPRFTGLADLVHRAEVEHSEREWQDDMQDTVRAIAGLTAVDGATLLTDRFELLAFGAKIARRDGWALVELTTVTEPIEDSTASVVHPSRLGGTRHLSAAQFVHDQRDSVALVASQDGRFTIFAWSACESMVHAHRVEALLL